MTDAAAPATGDAEDTPVPRPRHGLRPVTSLQDLAALADGDVYVRVSAGPTADREHTSRDHESGLELPGLSVVPLAPPTWWTRSREDWLARQVCRYLHLAEDGHDERYPWLLRGELVGRGPDNEPLLDAVEPIAWLPDDVVRAARRRYEERFDVGEDAR